MKMFARIAVILVLMASWVFGEIEIENGSTDVTVDFLFTLPSDGTLKTDVTVTNIDLYYHIQGTAISAKVDATAHAAATDAHTDNEAFNLGQGLYRIDWPDTCFDGGADTRVDLLAVWDVASGYGSCIGVKLVDYSTPAELQAEMEENGASTLDTISDRVTAAVATEAKQDIIDTVVDTLATRLTAARGGYLDNVNNANITDILATADGAVSTASGPTVIFIDGTNGNNAWDGLSAETAVADFATGLPLAPDGGTIMVAPGAYAAAVDFDTANKAIHLIGVGPKESIIIGTGNYGMTLESGCVIENVTVTGAYCGIKSASKDYIGINNCAILSTGKDYNEPAVGTLTITGGIQPKVSNCYIQGYYCAMYAAMNEGLEVTGTLGLVQNIAVAWVNVTVTDTYGFLDGTGGNTTNKATISDSIFIVVETDGSAQNTVANCYGMSLSDTTTVRNCVIQALGNTDASAAGIYMIGASANDSILIADSFIESDSVSQTDYSISGGGTGTIRVSSTQYDPDDTNFSGTILTSEGDVWNELRTSYGTRNSFGRMIYEIWRKTRNLRQ